MSPFHVTQHGTQVHGDAVDVFEKESELLRELLAKWNTTTPSRTMGGNAVPAKWDHGTIGKLLLEHTAVRLAASEDIERVLGDMGRVQERRQLEQTSCRIRPILDQMYDNSHGIQPISLAITPGFVEAVEQLQEVLRAELSQGVGCQSRNELVTALGSKRSRLRSAKYIRKHALAHPGPSRRWYDRVPFLLRIHAAEDRLRGFPWAESSLAHRKLAQRYDRED